MSEPDLTTMIQMLRLARLTEWQRDFLDIVGDAPRTQWQASQVRCLWREYYGR